jgi:hypothetical protein
MQGGRRHRGGKALVKCNTILLFAAACLLHLPVSLQGRQGSVSAGSATRILASKGCGYVDSNQCRISKRLVMALRGGAGRRKRLDWQSPRKHTDYASESSDEWNPDSGESEPPIQQHCLCFFCKPSNHFL